MHICDIIHDKQLGRELTDEQLEFFVKGYVKGDIADYQASALAMAIWYSGMTDAETAALTRYMARSGDTVDLSSIIGVTADKHSTGGVGDKTTMIVAPIAAACGLMIAKMSGRGLGHTGGTLDKLESIKGMNVEMSVAQLIEQVKRIGICVCAQSGDLVPADKKLYALRDVTSTIDSIPLIASSIMSKKLAADCQNILLDVKCGSGAFMKTPQSAVKLAELMVSIGQHEGVNTAALVTDMNVPLGNSIGNALEINEAVAVLKGQGPADLKRECLLLSSRLLELSGMDSPSERAASSLDSGAAYRKFVEMVTAQGGSEEALNSLPKAPVTYNVVAEKDGWVEGMDTQRVGISSMLLGAGRQILTDSIDPAAGIVLKKKTGDRVEKGDVLCELHTSDPGRLSEARAEFLSAVTISDEQPKAHSLLIATVSASGVRWSTEYEHLAQVQES